ncbi:MAG: SRPBCC family protein [Pseudomonadota bacterium]
MPENTDLVLTVRRDINAARSIVWKCWTDAELLKQWYVPRPWSLSEADLDVRPGGRFNSVMRGPEGERMDLVGCYLEVVPQERLIFSDSYSEGFMPRSESFMTGVVELKDNAAGGTTMVWSARHATAEAVQQHLDMGFEAGWNAAADQLEELVKTVS